MIVKYYNNATAHEAYFEFPKGTRKSAVRKHAIKWALEADETDPPLWIECTVLKGSRSKKTPRELGADNFSVILEETDS